MLLKRCEDWSSATPIAWNGVKKKKKHALDFTPRKTYSRRERNREHKGGDGFETNYEALPEHDAA